MGARIYDGRCICIVSFVSITLPRFLSVETVSRRAYRRSRSVVSPLNVIFTLFPTICLTRNRLDAREDARRHFEKPWVIHVRLRHHFDPRSPEGIPNPAGIVVNVHALT